jgi:hypothetical protein
MTQINKIKPVMDTGAAGCAVAWISKKLVITFGFLILD